MTAPFYIKEDDTLPALRVTLLDGANDPYDLTGSTVKFRMAVGPDDASKVDASANVITAASGIVEYRWVTGDTDTPGTYFGEFVVTTSGGKIVSFPNKDYLKVIVGAAMST